MQQSLFFKRFTVDKCHIKGKGKFNSVTICNYRELTDRPKLGKVCSNYQLPGSSIQVLYFFGILVGGWRSLVRKRKVTKERNVVCNGWDGRKGPLDTVTLV